MTASGESKRLCDLDERIKACIQDISDLFGGIENLDKSLVPENTDETSTQFHGLLKKMDLLLSDSFEISEYLLPHLDEIRKQNCMAYCDTNLQISKLDKEGNASNQLLWNNICFYLEKYSFSTVFKNYLPLSQLHNHFNLCQVRNYCVSMQNIFALKDIWEKYKEFRMKYVEIFVCDCKSDSCCFRCYLKLIIQCIYEDHLLCYIGCFHPHIVTQTNILDTYSKVIHDEFLGLLKSVNCALKTSKDLSVEVINMLLNSKDVIEENYKTCFTCFVQCSLISEIETIIHCVQNNMSTDTLWNKLFIFSILKVIELMSLFEDQINILFNLGKDINFHSHNDDLSSLFEGSKLLLATDSPEESPFHEAHQFYPEKSHSATKMLFSWNWRLILVENGFITEIQKALQMEVENVIKITTAREKKLSETNDWRNLISCDRKINFASLTVQTYTLLDSVLNTVLVLEKYIPILSTAVGVFQPFKYSFCHTLDTYVIDLLKHLEYLSEHRKNIYILYIVTNNAIFLKNQLKYYSDITEGSDIHVTEGCISNVCHSVDKFADEVLEALHNLHFKYVSCGILFDAESYNFEDTRPFFEGERISYSIQMWKMYMKGIYHDASYFLPQSFAQELYAKALSFSLDRFLIRYSKSSASEARHLQLLKDIYAILLCTTELLYPACSYVSDVIGKKEEFNESKIASIMNKIHSNCCCLLSVIIILTAPMSELYNVFKDGFPQPRLSLRSKYECISPWLPWICRELFSNLGQSKIMSNVSVWLAVRVCTTYKVPLPNAVILAFTEHHCTLSILLMMQATAVAEEEASLSLILEENKINLAYSLSVLMLCYDNYSFLLDIFFPVIEKKNSWNEFDASSSEKFLSNRSWWYKGLYKAFKPFLKSTFEELPSFWFEIKKKIREPEALKLWLSFREELKNFVVCVCQSNFLNSFNENFNFSSEVVSFLCVKKVLEKIKDNLMFMPLPFKYALICINAHIANYMPEIHPTENSVCIQFLLSSAITYFKEQDFINTLPDSVRDMAIITSDAIGCLCKRENNFLQNKDYKKVLCKLLNGIQKEFDGIRDNFDTRSKSANFDEIQDDVIKLAARKLVEEPKGVNIIYNLHQILCANESWIQRNLGIPDMLSSDIVVSPISPSPLLRSNFDSPRESMSKKDADINLQTSNLAGQKYSERSAASRGESFDSAGSLEQTFVISQDIIELNKENEMQNHNKLNLLIDESISKPTFEFNPLKDFDCLGASTFAKLATETPSLPWEALLSHLPILGITEINFQFLFSQRWDVKNETDLSSEEMRHIEELKNMYKYEE